jgi:hypothetical protein
MLDNEAVSPVGKQGSPGGQTGEGSAGVAFLDINLDFIGKMFAEKMGNIEPTKIEATMEEVSYSRPAKSNRRVVYDPEKPNEYEKVLREREVAAEEEQRVALEEEYRLKQQLYGTTKPELPQELVRIMDESGPLIDRKIVKMLEKNGWEYGKGMGAEEKGMLNPLIPVKTAGQMALIQETEDPAFLALIGQAPGQSSKVGQPPQAQAVTQKTVIYQSGPVVEDPRIKPIQEKYFRA